MADRPGGIFSEQYKGRRQSADDMLFGVDEGVDALQSVKVEPQPQCVKVLFDCGRCGRQTGLVYGYPEFLCYYTGIKVKGSQPTAQGMLVRVRCRCSQVNPLLFTWADVQQIVQDAVRQRRIPAHLVPQQMTR